MEMREAFEKNILTRLDDRTEAAKERYLNRLERVKRLRTIDGKETWNAFDGDLLDYFDAGSHWINLRGIGGYDVDKLKKEMSRRLELIHALGKKMLMLDLMGQGRACVQLGADKVFTTGLMKFNSRYSNVEQVIGDALSDEKTAELYNKIIDAERNENYSLQVILFRPVGGLSISSMNLYVFRTLYKRLQELYDLLDDGGLIFISTIGSDLDTELLEAMLRATGCEDILLTSPKRGKLGIRKSASKHSRLPSELEAARATPGLIEQLMKMDDEDRMIPND